MRVFVSAIEGGGFSAAAKALGMTPSAVSKLVMRLERRLGVRLLNRTTRQLALTPEGETYFVASQRIILAVGDLENEIATASGRPRGPLRVSCGLTMGLRHLGPALADFLGRYPEIRVDLSLTDKTVDLHADKVDIALRTGPQPDSSLVARKLADIERIVCASACYIEKHGAPKLPADLARHHCIVVTTGPGLDRWPFRGNGDETEHVHVSGPVAVNTADCAYQLALSGAGIARLSDMLVGDAIRHGQLVQVLPDRHHVAPIPLWAVFPAGTQKLPRVRAFLDFLLERFGRSPWRLDPHQPPSDGAQAEAPSSAPAA
jgi:DNA-binding transcriptional LysR family regulator